MCRCVDCVGLCCVQCLVKCSLCVSVCVCCGAWNSGAVTGSILRLAPALRCGSRGAQRAACLPAAAAPLRTVMEQRCHIARVRLVAHGGWVGGCLGAGGCVCLTEPLWTLLLKRPVLGQVSQPGCHAQVRRQHGSRGSAVFPLSGRHMIQWSAGIQTAPNKPWCSCYAEAETLVSLCVCVCFRGWSSHRTRHQLQCFQCFQCDPVRANCRQGRVRGLSPEVTASHRSCSSGPQPGSRAITCTRGSHCYPDKSVGCCCIRTDLRYLCSPSSLSLFTFLW